MKTANELKSGIFASAAMLLRGADYTPPAQEKEEVAALEDPGFGKEASANAVFDAASPGLKAGKAEDAKSK